MQIFEVYELTKPPYCAAKRVIGGTVVSDVINDANKYKVYLLVDHDTRKVWIYIGSRCSLKLQGHSTILANQLIRQLRFFHKIYSLNKYSKHDKEFQILMNKKLGLGRAKPIERKEENILVSLPRSSIESMMDFIRINEEQVKTLEDSLKLKGEKVKILEKKYDLQQEELINLKSTSTEKKLIIKLEKEMDLLSDEISRTNKNIAHLRKNLEREIENVERLKEILRKMIRDKGDHDSGFITPFPHIPPSSPGAAGSAKQKVERVVLVEEAEYELICKYCGSKLAKENKFCKLCGKKVE